MEVDVTPACHDVPPVIGDGTGDLHVSGLIQSGTHLLWFFLFKLSKFSQGSFSEAA